MSNRSKIKLEPGERILAVVPEYASGPGWANAPTWVYVGKSDNTYRAVCIQPLDRSPELGVLFGPGEAMHRALVAAVSKEVRVAK